jgi:hypothetical protein
MSRDDGIIGVSDHGGWAVLVTVAGDVWLANCYFTSHKRACNIVTWVLPAVMSQTRFLVWTGSSVR